MATHVTMKTHKDGKEIFPKIAWCGQAIAGFAFLDAQHVLLAITQGTGIQPCKNCLKKMRKAIDQELDGIVKSWDEN